MSVIAPIRVGVVGVGRIGRMHAAMLARDVPGLSLAAVHDTDAGTAAAVARELGVPETLSSRDLIERPDVDAVAICSSTNAHVELVAEAAATGKPLFLEKPVSLELVDVDRALAAVSEAGVFLQLGLNRRFDPAHRSVRDAVESGAVGELHLVRITSRDPEPPPLDYVRVSGGIFLDMTVHDLDMARFVTGSEVDEVFARGEVRVDPAIGEVGDLDTVVVTLRHADGTLTVIDNSRRAAYGYDQRVEAFGARGMAASGNPPEHTGFVLTGEGRRGAVLPHFFLQRYRTSYVAAWASFEQSVRSGSPPVVTGADGRLALVLGLAARRSASEGRPVRVSEVA
ncbi:MAG TPA: inositol 2-dehydrogenase [Gaiella sp.]|nr:inositol 2-dehydrogenase [Gaiella sp.]